MRIDITDFAVDKVMETFEGKKRSRYFCHNFCREKFRKLRSRCKEYGYTYGGRPIHMTQDEGYFIVTDGKHEFVYEKNDGYMTVISYDRLYTNKKTG